MLTSQEIGILVDAVQALRDTGDRRLSAHGYDVLRDKLGTLGQETFKVECDAAMRQVGAELNANADKVAAALAQHIERSAS